MSHPCSPCEVSVLLHEARGMKTYVRRKMLWCAVVLCSRVTGITSGAVRFRKLEEGIWDVLSRNQMVDILPETKW